MNRLRAIGNQHAATTSVYDHGGEAIARLFEHELKFGQRSKTFDVVDILEHNPCRLGLGDNLAEANGEVSAFALLSFAGY